LTCSSSRAGAAILLWVALLLGGVASAADDSAGARQHFETGTRLFQVGEYRKALEEFRAAHVAKPDPAFLYNSAQCHRLLGERREALTLYRRFLVLEPETPKRPLVEKQIRELELATAPPTPPPAPVVLADRPAAAPPANPPLHRRWWLWAGIVAVTAGVVTAVALSSRGPRDPGCPREVMCFP
jgi:tetratricopeptide (TPR) repeat protein